MADEARGEACAKNVPAPTRTMPSSTDGRLGRHQGKPQAGHRERRPDAALVPRLYGAAGHGVVAIEGTNTK